MLTKAREALGFLWQVINKFFGDGCSSMAAALSFYTFFSLPPLLALLLMLAGTIVDPVVVRGAIVGQATELIGAAAAVQVEAILEHGSRTELNATAAAVLSGFALLLGSTAAFAQLQTALDRAWAVQPDPQRGQIRNFLLQRVLAFGVVLAIAFLLLVALVLSAGLAAFGDLVAARMPGGASQPLLWLLDFVVSLAVITTLFAVMLKVIPDAEIAWRDVWVGALATGLLFVVGKFAIGAYLGSTDPGSAYGAAGSLAIILIWVYYSSMIVLFGAEFTRVWADRYGGGVRPAPGAVEVVAEAQRIRRPNEGTGVVTTRDVRTGETKERNT